MSQGNVELTRRAVELFNSRDLDAFLEMNDPAIEFAPVETAVQGGQPYRGHEGVREWWRDAFEIFPDLRIEAGELRDLGAKTLARVHLLGSGAGSGVAIDREVWGLVSWREGKAVSWFSFETEAEALEAADP